MRKIMGLPETLLISPPETALGFGIVAFVEVDLLEVLLLEIF